MSVKQVTYLADGWSFRRADAARKGEWLSAIVPGFVHQDLHRHGVIPDPFRRMHEQGVAWVDQADWEYQTTFEWQPNAELPKRVLRFEGLDTVCTIFLNGESVACNDNMHVPLEVDVTDKLVAGTNTVRIEFYSADRIGSVRKAAYFAQEGLREDSASFFNRSFVRKGQWMFGWDWGPELISCGIWKPVQLVEYRARLTDVWVRQEHKPDGRVEVEFVPEVEGEGKVAIHLIGVGELESLGTVITDPHLWWCNGMGQPHLYTALAVLEDGDEMLDERWITFGLRTVRVIRDVDSHGESFQFELNGRKVFAVGANWIPQHSFPHSATSPEPELIKAHGAGMNMLRVWGGGLYESDEFYAACDALGLLVWQDFAYGCAYYPDDEPAQAVARVEAEANIKRIRNHPSLALWCGNNENLMMWHNEWGGHDKTPPRYYGENIYDQVLPAAVAEHCPDVPYIDSSPTGALSKPAEKGTDHDANAGGWGDQHYWDVWHGRGDWKHYDDSTARFCSEFGFISSPSLEAWSQVLDPSDTDPFGPVVRWHDKSGKGYEKYLGMVELHYPRPQTLDDLVYYTQLNQRDAMRYALEHYRRSEFCRGALIWQLNDCWQVQSWALMDFLRNEKPAMREMRRVFAPGLLGLRVENGKVTLWGALHNFETPAEVEYRLIAASSLTGEPHRVWEGTATLKPEVAMTIDEFSVEGLPAPETLVLLQYVVNGEGYETARLLVEPKELRLNAPQPILVQWTPEGLNARFEGPVVDLWALTGSVTDEELALPVTSLGGEPVSLPVSVPGEGGLRLRSLAGEHPIRWTRTPLG